MSSIIGEGGRAKEAQRDFLVLLEDSIRKFDKALSVQRYQNALDKARARLNLAVAPMAWLMPASMIINTSGTAKYNNKLKQATNGVVFGVNNSLNPAVEAGGGAKSSTKNIVTPVSSTQTQKEIHGDNLKPESENSEKNIVSAEEHESNKTATLIGVLVLAGFVGFAVKKLSK